MSARDTAFQRALEPASATFTPCPYKLAQVIRSHGDEYSSNDTPKPYNNQLFDPWRRGDLVVIEYVTVSYAATTLKQSRRSAWYVGRRHTTPSAERQKVRLSNDGVPFEIGNRHTLWRIVLRYYAAAEKLIGREFATREELEAALDNPEAVAIAEAA